MSPLQIPPLRERAEEIGPLVAHFVQHASAVNACEAKGISSEVMAQFQRYHWPGNVREIRNVVERAVIIAAGSVSTTSDKSNGPQELVQRRSIAFAVTSKLRPG